MFLVQYSALLCLLSFTSTLALTSSSASVTTSTTGRSPATHQVTSNHKSPTTSSSILGSHGPHHPSLSHSRNTTGPSKSSTHRPSTTQREVYGLRNHANTTSRNGFDHDANASGTHPRPATNSSISANQTSSSTALPDSASDNSQGDDSQENAQLPDLTNGTSINGTSSSGTNGLSDFLNDIMSSTNITCGETTQLTGLQLWQQMHVDMALENFTTMFNEDALICDQCFGLTASQCSSRDNETCARGLRTTSGDNSDGPSWSVAAGLYSRAQGLNDYSCKLGPGPCSAAPLCGSVPTGPAAWAILQSLSTAHNSYQTSSDAMSEAVTACDLQLANFTAALAPIPDTSGTAIGLIIASVLIGGLIALLPGLGAVLGGLVVGIGSGVGLEEYFTHQASGADESKPLYEIFTTMQSNLLNITNSLFGTGAWTHTNNGNNETMSLQDFMSNGSLLKADTLYNATEAGLSQNYQHLMFQQLAVITWQDLQADGYNHTPFIGFDSGPCAKVDPSKSISVGNLQLPGVGKLDVSVDFQGDCYYLLDAIPSGVGSISDAATKCNGAHALPGGTHTEMRANNFSGLCVEDFVIPSVLGWLNNSKVNGYKNAFAENELIQDPQAQGVVNFPVCDLLAPTLGGIGVGCPLLGSDADASNGCFLVPANDGPAPPGTYQAGKCGVAVEQYQRTESNENPFHAYQLAVTITDSLGRAVGEATKQLAPDILDIVDSSLPYDLYVSAGTGDQAPIQFWYSDQFWDSSNTSPDNNCNSTAYATGIYFSRNILRETPFTNESI